MNYIKNLFVNFSSRNNLPVLSNRERETLILSSLQEKVYKVGMIILDFCHFIYTPISRFIKSKISVEEKISIEQLALAELDLGEYEAIVTVREEKEDGKVQLLSPSSCLTGVAQGSVKRSIADRLIRNQIDAINQQLNEIPKGYKGFERPVNPKVLIKDKQCIMIRGESGSVNRKMVGIASTMGFRDEMEDKEIAVEGSFLVQERCYSFDLFGIFDGHGGKQASAYVKVFIKDLLIEALERENQNELTDQGIFVALKNCFATLDKEYDGRDGTTATIALVLEGKIWVANVGDSRIILVDKEGKSIQATEDAKPNMATYLKKIQKLGGEIHSIKGIWRVNGILAVARAIGDKTIKGSSGLCCVSASPKITRFSLADFNQGHLVLACDGLYDVASTNEVGEVVHSMGSKFSVENMSRKLVYGAIQKGSKDNVSVIVVKL